MPADFSTGCDARDVSQHLRHLSSIVAHYKRVHRPRTLAERASFAAERTLEDAIRRAALTLPRERPPR